MRCDVKMNLSEEALTYLEKNALAPAVHRELSNIMASGLVEEFQEDIKQRRDSLIPGSHIFSLSLFVYNKKQQDVIDSMLIDYLGKEEAKSFLKYVETIGKET